jgi:hypothetical protein
MASVRGFVLTDKVKADEVFKGQQGLIMGVLRATGASPLTVGQIADQIKDRLETRQEPERVVAFYMSVYKKKGLVQVMELAGEESPNGSAAEGEGESAEDPDDDEVDEEEVDEEEEEGQEASSTPSAPPQPEAMTAFELSPIGMSVSDAILWVYDSPNNERGEEYLDEGVIITRLEDVGFKSPASPHVPVGLASIRGALQNLARRGEVRREGKFWRRTR